jgi:hypothetical protein
MRDRYDITIQANDTGLWIATTTHPRLTATGATLRDALDELAILLERGRHEHDNAPH